MPLAQAILEQLRAEAERHIITNNNHIQKSCSGLLMRAIII
jgi:hypothetical protein